jgi:D-hexose-6-phosphate mutarotase
VDGDPATYKTEIAEREREFVLWEEKEKEALSVKEQAEEEERARVCIWCGHLCESLEALEEHEAACE